MEYTSVRLIDGKPRKVIVDKIGKIVNRNPNKDELKGLEKENPRVREIYTNEELLNYLKRFCQEKGRVPVTTDFINNLEYPSITTYRKRFGSWSNTLSLISLDIDTMVKNGILITNDQKGRFAEMIIRDHFKRYSEDLSGKNKNSPFDVMNREICGRKIKIRKDGREIYD